MGAARSAAVTDGCRLHEELRAQSRLPLPPVRTELLLGSGWGWISLEATPLRSFSFPLPLHLPYSAVYHAHFFVQIGEGTIRMRTMHG